MPELAAWPPGLQPGTHLGPRYCDPARHWPLHGLAATRLLEAAALAQAPQPRLMQRAGQSVARLALALAPHARHIWVACGPGHNGGDGLEAAAWLQRWGKSVSVTWLGSLPGSGTDIGLAHAHAVAAGVRFDTQPPAQYDLGIDALLGIGASRAPRGALAAQLRQLCTGAAPVLAVDLPSGLDADTGQLSGQLREQLHGPTSETIKTIATDVATMPARANFCLSLLTLKPGLFTGAGKDSAGQVWWDDLGLAALLPAHALATPTAWLHGAPGAPAPTRPHNSHKGSYGDVAVLGGAPGMTGAALLAARAALHAGAGRVWVALLDGAGLAVDPGQPELMLRPAHALDLDHSTVVCGCGGGEAVRAQLPRVLSRAQRLVLDADALNALAGDSSLQTLLQARAARGAVTVLTPHPLEAARLLGLGAAQVQADRLAAAQALAQRFACVVVLKGAGSVVAAPGQLPRINASGNARLATAGTGDVLAGMLGAALAQPLRVGGSPAGATAATAVNGATDAAWIATCHTVFRHGLAAQRWPDDRPLTADALARSQFTL